MQPQHVVDRRGTLPAPERRRLLARRMHVGMPVDDHAALLLTVVPAKAGTHTPCAIDRPGRMGPRFRGDDTESVARSSTRHSHIFAACARSSSSLTSVPQPGPVGSTISPFSITGGWVRSFGFHGTSSTSYSEIRRLGMTAAKCPQMIADKGPLK